MTISPIFQENEIYYCINCSEDKVTYTHIKDGRCPDCGKPIEIKLTVEDSEHSCHRIRPDELEIDDILVYKSKSYTVINILKNTDYRIALKGYGVLTVTPDSTLTTINGGWYR